MQQCGECRAELPGRVYIGVVTGPREGVFRLQLHDGLFQTGQEIVSEALLIHRRFRSETGMATDRVEHDQRILDTVTAGWRRMESKLDAFASQWRANRQSATPDPAGRSPYLFDVPPPPLRRGRRT